MNYTLQDIDDSIVECNKNRFPTIVNLIKDENWPNYRIDWIKNAILYMWLNGVSPTNNQYSNIIHSTFEKYTTTGLII